MEKFPLKYSFFYMKAKVFLFLAKTGLTGFAYYEENLCNSGKNVDKIDKNR